MTTTKRRPYKKIGTREVEAILNWIDRGRLSPSDFAKKIDRDVKAVRQWRSFYLGTEELSPRAKRIIRDLPDDLRRRFTEPFADEMVRPTSAQRGFHPDPIPAVPENLTGGTVVLASCGTPGAIEQGRYKHQWHGNECGLCHEVSPDEGIQKEITSLANDILSIAERLERLASKVGPLEESAVLLRKLKEMTL